MYAAVHIQERISLLKGCNWRKNVLLRVGVILATRGDNWPYALTFGPDEVYWDACRNLRLYYSSLTAQRSRKKLLAKY